MQQTSDALADLQRAIAQTGRIVAAVRLDQAALPTPCEQWRVRDLVDHLISGLAVFRRMALGEPRGEFRGQLSGDDWAAQYDAHSAKLLDAWRELERSGRPPTETLLGLTTMDVVIHGWDLAQATGQRPEFDEPLGAHVLSFAQGFVRPEGRAETREKVGGSVPLGPAIPVPDDSPVYTRLAAFLGRPV